jgi:pimeloyl-ACP methyl ester carboxylesterase
MRPFIYLVNTLIITVFFYVNGCGAHLDGLSLFQKQAERVGFSTKNYLEKQRKYLNGGFLESVTFASQKALDAPGEKLMRTGLLYLNPKAQATVLVCHGFMCDKFDIGFLRRTLFSDYNVMVFDFRAHGEQVDEEQCCTFGRDEALDVKGAVDYLKARPDLNNLPRIAYGFSMGAVAAIQAQAADSSLFAAMVLDCPFDTAKNVIKQSIEKLNIHLFGYTFEFPGKKLLEKFAFNSYVQSFLKTLLKTVAQLDATATNTVIYPLNPVDSIKNICAPCFLIHCRNDEKVSVDAARALFNNVPGYKRLWITNGRRHFDSIFYNPEKYNYKVNAFIKSVLNETLYKKVNAKVYSDEVIM